MMRYAKESRTSKTESKGLSVLYSATGRILGNLPFQGLPLCMKEKNMKEEIIGRFDSIDDLAIWLRAYRGYSTLRQYRNGLILTSEEHGDAIIDRDAECVAFPCEVDEKDLESCDTADSIQVSAGYFWFDYKDLAVCNFQLCVIRTTGQYAEEAE